MEIRTGMKRYVIAYDIADDKRRSNVVKELKNVGYRIQYSLFEADLTMEALIGLRMRIGDVIKRTEDSVIYYARCARCQKDVIRDGLSVNPLDDEDMYYL